MSLTGCAVGALQRVDDGGVFCSVFCLGHGIAFPEKHPLAKMLSHEWTGGQGRRACVALGEEKWQLARRRNHHTNTKSDHFFLFFALWTGLLGGITYGPSCELLLSLCLLPPPPLATPRLAVLAGPASPGPLCQTEGRRSVVSQPSLLSGQLDTSSGEASLDGQSMPKVNWLSLTDVKDGLTDIDAVRS